MSVAGKHDGSALRFALVCADAGLIAIRMPTIAVAHDETPGAKMQQVRGQSPHADEVGHTPSFTPVRGIRIEGFAGIVFCCDCEFGRCPCRWYPRRCHRCRWECRAAKVRLGHRFATRPRISCRPCFTVVFPRRAASRLSTGWGHASCWLAWDCAAIRSSCCGCCGCPVFPAVRYVPDRATKRGQPAMLAGDPKERIGLKFIRADQGLLQERHVGCGDKRGHEQLSFACFQHADIAVVHRYVEQRIEIPSCFFDQGRREQVLPTYVRLNSPNSEL